MLYVIIHRFYIALFSALQQNDRGLLRAQTPSTGLRHPSFNHCRIYSYATGSMKLSANAQFFVGAQTVGSLLQTTEIKQGVSFIAATKFTPA